MFADLGIGFFFAMAPAWLLIVIWAITDYRTGMIKLEIERLEKEIELEKLKWKNRAGKLTQPIQEEV